MNFIDRFLNKITMYRLVLYYLSGLLLIAMVLGIFHLVPYSPLAIIGSSIILLAVCWVTNTIFVSVFKAHANVESVYITAMILALILAPLHNARDVWFLAGAAALAIASKFIFAIGKKHIFNPVAISVLLTAYALNFSALWWVGTLWMLPFVLVGGFLVVRKIQRSDLVVSFLVTAFVVTMFFCVIDGSSVTLFAKELLIDSPLFFFAFVMLTEPLTTPPTKKLQIWYGAIVGALFAPQLHIGGVYSTPELALVIGNIFSYVVSPKQKLLLTLREKTPLAAGTFEFSFSADKAIVFLPGQYLEWTLAHEQSDARGNRRYFTIASSPSEQYIRLAVKFQEPSSSFKKQLLAMKPGDTLMAGQLAGDFTMPRDPKQKLVFIAGGIGITPFRSMVQDLLDRGERRDLIVLYANRTAEDVAYRTIFDRATAEIGMKTMYTFSGNGEYITEEMIRKEVPDYAERVFYISGPNSMVDSFEKMLFGLGLRRNQIKVDYFPGF